MIEIKFDKKNYTLWESGWIVGTFKTVRELREKLREIINFKYYNHGYLSPR